MKASFVIVNYNRKDEVLLTITKTKDVIRDIPYDFEIVVVDNASVDGSVQAIQAQHPDVTLIANPVNTGAPAWNLGLAKAKGDYFIILDDDSHIEKGLKEALEYMDAHILVGVLALNIQGGAYETTKWINLEEKVGFIGCGAIVKRELYEKIGFYAEWIFLYSNEWEYGIRTLEAGYKLIYFENCVVRHRASVINRTSKRLIVFSVRNEMAIVYKYFSENIRSKYVRRVFINNLKGVVKYGFGSINWYYTALKEFNELKKTLPHTPAKKEVQNAYITKFWSTKFPLSGMFIEE
jgi:GT2 family glycosyltransferase